MRILTDQKFNIKHFIFLLNYLADRIVLLLFTFIVGITMNSLSSENLPSTMIADNSLPMITLCQLERDPENYNGKTIQIEGDASDLDGLIYISDRNCKMVEIQRAPDYKPDVQTQELASKLHSGNFKARISVTGNFDSEGTQGCFGTKFAIRATSVKLK